MTSAQWQDIGEGLIASLAYVGVAVVLLGLGFFVLDLLSPGRLSTVIMRDRNRNAAVVASAGMLGLAIVVGTSVLTTRDDFTSGLITTAIFGLVGVLLQALVFVILDRLTPGKLGDVVCDDADHPGAYLIAASLLASGIIVATCIS
ncbi:MAG TPA: DUF350 domain-containing protein [Acidimicrobiales bacterium]|nr:DUF350 domain-containing protein [Acidimicrobiales bacterium]